MIPLFEQLTHLIVEASMLTSEDIFYDSSLEDDYPNDSYTASINRLNALPAEMKKLTDQIGSQYVLVSAEDYVDLIEAAQSVIRNWEHGDLAGAVRKLSELIVTLIIEPEQPAE